MAQARRRRVRRLRASLGRGEVSGCGRLLVAELDQEVAAGPGLRLLERAADGQRRGVQEEAVAAGARQRSGASRFDGDVVTLGDAQADLEALHDVVLAAGAPARALAGVVDLGAFGHDPGLASARAGLGQQEPELSLHARHQLDVLDRSPLWGREMAAVLYF